MTVTTERLRTVQSVLKDAEQQLREHGTESPTAESKYLVAFALDMSFSDLYQHAQRTVKDSQFEKLDRLCKRRIQGEPVQYITGQSSFHTIEIDVGSGVFIPRPETELIVELFLDRFRAEGGILDLCTGSGAIVLAITKELGPHTPIIGIDISKAALKWAQRNAKKQSLNSIKFYEGDLFAPLPKDIQFEAITINPPYIRERDFPTLPTCVRNFEPYNALIASEDGFSIIRRVAEKGQRFLIDNGFILCEIGESQGPEATGIFESNGWQDVTIHQDLNTRDRVISARKNKRRS